MASQHHESLETAVFADDGRVPNNRWPVLLYRRAVTPDAADPAASFEAAFSKNGWTNSWRDGIYPFHHYHSTSHEALGIARGHGRVRLGGERGCDFDLRAGDVIVLPAGTGHKRLSATADFLVVGAYPGGRDWDLIRVAETDGAAHDAALERIRRAPMPDNDPLFGRDGPLRRLWVGT